MARRKCVVNKKVMNSLILVAVAGVAGWFIHKWTTTGTLGLCPGNGTSLAMYRPYKPPHGGLY